MLHSENFSVITFNVFYVHDSELGWGIIIAIHYTTTANYIISPFTIHIQSDQKAYCIQLTVKQENKGNKGV